ncbi:MAG: bifunctional diaminohydroxyphosphoribosylaminopyrimidine deaminase/5-amino-6-(5-phosphoribosylamino)uracil reductase RibD [Bacteroidia bacterium]|nr:bifunctional diaminohydroxyphosphoribosylaminopyrimidine deaminase/5-amino-6-(5-phosphoribosylamino)uracil reductase RibD [Bacteroidia bacterium]
MRHFFDHPKAVNLSDHSFLYRCIELAQKARRDVYPNPYVGAVLVHKGKIIGEGYHQYAGGPHAEVNAINSVRDRSLLKDSTIYVSLEPCSHYGKTPPCSDLILHHNIPRVVIGVRDPNPKVDGGGIGRLKSNGVEVLLADDPSDFIYLNKVFWVNQLQKRTFISLKWAESRDGFMAGSDENGISFPVQITDSHQNRKVHALRAYHHGILIGTDTAAIDDPSLTTRCFPGRNPIRLVMDRHLRLNENLRLFQDGLPTWIINEKKEEEGKFLKYIRFDFQSGLKALMKKLWKEHQLASVLVEGGAQILNSFLLKGLYDEVNVFQGKMDLEKGLRAPEKPDGLAWDDKFRAYQGNYLSLL